MTHVARARCVTDTKPDASFKVFGFPAAFDPTCVECGVAFFLRAISGQSPAYSSEAFEGALAARKATVEQLPEPFNRLFTSGKDAETLLKEGDRGQISDTGQIEEAAAQAIEANAQAVADYKAGKEQAVKFLVGQVMRVTRGRANPQLVSELIKEKLEKE